MNFDQSSPTSGPKKFRAYSRNMKHTKLVSQGNPNEKRDKRGRNKKRTNYIQEKGISLSTPTSPVLNPVPNPVTHINIPTVSDSEDNSSDRKSGHALKLRLVYNPKTNRYDPKF